MKPPSDYVDCSVVFLNRRKNTQFYITGCKIGRFLYKLLISNVYCGAYGTRTRDPMRDRHVF